MIAAMEQPDSQSHPTSQPQNININRLVPELDDNYNIKTQLLANITNITAINMSTATTTIQPLTTSYSTTVTYTTTIRTSRDPTPMVTSAPTRTTHAPTVLPTVSRNVTSSNTAYLSKYIHANFNEPTVEPTEAPTDSPIVTQSDSNSHDTLTSKFEKNPLCIRILVYCGIGLIVLAIILGLLAKNKKRKKCLIQNTDYDMVIAGVDNNRDEREEETQDVKIQMHPIHGSIYSITMQKFQGFETVELQ